MLDLDITLETIDNNLITSINLANVKRIDYLSEPKLGFEYNFLDHKDTNLKQGSKDDTSKLEPFRFQPPIIVNNKLIFILPHSKYIVIANQLDKSDTKLLKVSERIGSGHFASSLLPLDDNTVAVAVDGDYIQLWNINTGKRIKELSIHHNKWIPLVKISERQIALSKRKDNVENIVIWDVDKDACVATYDCKAKEMLGLLKYGNTLFSIDRENIRIWELTTNFCKIIPFQAPVLPQSAYSDVPAILSGTTIGHHLCLIFRAEGSDNKQNNQYVLQIWDINKKEIIKHYLNKYRIEAVFRYQSGTYAILQPRPGMYHIVDIFSGEIKKIIDAGEGQGRLFVLPAQGSFASLNMQGISIYSLETKSLSFYETNFIIKALHANESVTSIDLTGCEVDDHIAVEVAKLLQKNFRITKLKLGNNKIADIGARALLAAISSNYAVQEIDLSGNSINPGIVLAIEEQIKRRIPSAPPENENNKTKIPEEFIDSTHLEVMYDPVTTSEEGFSYERVELSRWLEDNDTSPLSNTILVNKILSPNNALRGLIDRFIEDNPDIWCQDILHIPEDVKQKIIEAITTSNVTALRELVANRFRLLVTPIGDAPHLLAYTCEQGTPDIIKQILTLLKDNFWKLITTFQRCERLFLLAAKNPHGADAAAIIAQHLGWGQNELLYQLQQAAMNGDLETVKACISLGCPVNYVDQYKMTPLLWSVKHKHPHVTEYLLSQGVHLEFANDSGQTALDIAIKAGDVQTVNLLEEAKSRYHAERNKRLKEVINNVLILIQNENYTAAMEDCKSIIHTNTFMANDIASLAYLYWGYCAEALHRYDEAYYLYLRALELDPTNIQAKSAADFLKKKQIINQENEAERVNDKLQQNIKEADTEMANGDYKSAADMYSKLIELFPTSAKLHYHYAIVLLHLQQFPQAKQYYLKAFELSEANNKQKQTDAKTFRFNYDALFHMGRKNVFLRNQFFGASEKLKEGEDVFVQLFCTMLAEKIVDGGIAAWKEEKLNQKFSLNHPDITIPTNLRPKMVKKIFDMLIQDWSRVSCALNSSEAYKSLTDYGSGLVKLILEKYTQKDTIICPRLITLKDDLMKDQFWDPSARYSFKDVLADNFEFGRENKVKRFSYIQ